MAVIWPHCVRELQVQYDFLRHTERKYFHREMSPKECILHLALAASHPDFDGIENHIHLEQDPTILNEITAVFKRLVSRKYHILSQLAHEFQDPINNVRFKRVLPLNASYDEYTKSLQDLLEEHHEQDAAYHLTASWINLQTMELSIKYLSIVERVCSIYQAKLQMFPDHLDELYRNGPPYTGMGAERNNLIEKLRMLSCRLRVFSAENAVFLSDQQDRIQQLVARINSVTSPSREPIHLVGR